LTPLPISLSYPPSPSLLVIFTSIPEQRVDLRLTFALLQVAISLTPFSPFSIPSFPFDRTPSYFSPDFLSPSIRKAPPLLSSPFCCFLYLEFFLSEGAFFTSLLSAGLAILMTPVWDLWDNFGFDPEPSFFGSPCFFLPQDPFSPPLKDFRTFLDNDPPLLWERLFFFFGSVFV